MAMSQMQLIFSYYRNNPNRDIPHKEVVPWAMAEWEKRTGKVFADPDRAIRTLCDKELLIKRSKGVYCYDPKNAKERKQIPFTALQKKEIFERDDYKCVQCGRGEREGQEIHADHIRARKLGGESTVDNGQTLCSQHNNQKKTLNQTETGKKMFIGFRRQALKDGNTELVDFFHELLEVYDKHNINGHIKWDKES